MPLLNTPTMNAFWRRLEQREATKLRSYHFCAEFQEAPGLMHVFDGTVTTGLDLQHKDAYAALKAEIALSMTPPRPAERLILRTLSLLA